MAIPSIAPDARRSDALPATAHVVARGCALLVVATLLLAAQPARRFTLGDSREAVRQVQGPPAVIERLTSLGVEHWSYDRATVSFDGGDGRVIGWNDPTRALRVSLRPSRRGDVRRGTAEIRLGDDLDAVVRRLGTPWAISRSYGGAHRLLAYGNSVVRLRADDDIVDAWTVRDSAFPVAADERQEGERAMRATVASTGERAPRAMRDAVAPPSLRGEVRWRDEDGDGVLRARESLRVTLLLRNEGDGAARRVHPQIDVESPRGALDLVDRPSDVDIAPFSTHVVTFTLRAAERLESSEVVAVVGAREGRGFHLAPAQRIRIPAQATGAPRLVVKRVRIDDANGDGRLAPRELGDVTVTIGNDGDAPTGGLHARLLLGEDLFIAGGAPSRFSLGDVPPGSTASVTVSLYTNARATRADARLELSDERGGIVARLAIPLPIVPGGASLAVDALLARDSTAGNARRSAMPPPSALDDVEHDLPRAAALRPDAIAVILGIERYRRLPDARFAARDAALVRRYVTRTLGVPDDDEHVVVRTDADATGNELRRLFGENGWLARRVTANTELFVFFAGHGAPDGTGREPHLLPFDADAAYVGETGFALGTLYDRLARLPARTITVALDACFSGLSRDRQPLVAGTRPGTLSIEHPALLRRNMAVFAAARGAQAAGSLADARHGAFTWYLARALRGEADADADGSITVVELGRFLERGVSRAAAADDREQRPLTIARDSMRVVSRVPRRR